MLAEYKFRPNFSERLAQRENAISSRVQNARIETTENYRVWVQFLNPVTNTVEAIRLGAKQEDEKEVNQNNSKDSELIRAVEEYLVLVGQKQLSARYESEIAERLGENDSEFDEAFHRFIAEGEDLRDRFEREASGAQKTASLSGISTYNAFPIGVKNGFRLIAAAGIAFMLARGFMNQNGENIPSRESPSIGEVTPITVQETDKVTKIRYENPNPTHSDMKVKHGKDVTGFEGQIHALIGKNIYGADPFGEVAPGALEYQNAKFSDGEEFGKRVEKIMSWMKQENPRALVELDGQLWLLTQDEKGRPVEIAIPKNLVEVAGSYTPKAEATPEPVGIPEPAVPQAAEATESKLVAPVEPAPASAPEPGPTATPQRLRGVDPSRPDSYMSKNPIRSEADLIARAKIEQRLKDSLTNLTFSVDRLSEREIVKATYATLRAEGQKLGLTAQDIDEMFPINQTIQMYAVKDGKSGLIDGGVRYVEPSQANPGQRRFSVNETVYLVHQDGKFVLIREVCVNPIIPAKVPFKATTTPTTTVAPAPTETPTPAPAPLQPEVAPRPAAPAPKVTIPYGPPSAPEATPVPPAPGHTFTCEFLDDRRGFFVVDRELLPNGIPGRIVNIVRPAPDCVPPPPPSLPGRFARCEYLHDRQGYFIVEREDRTQNVTNIVRAARPEECGILPLPGEAIALKYIDNGDGRLDPRTDRLASALEDVNIIFSIRDNTGRIIRQVESRTINGIARISAPGPDLIYTIEEGVLPQGVRFITSDSQGRSTVQGIDISRLVNAILSGDPSVDPAWILNSPQITITVTPTPTPTGTRPPENPTVTNTPNPDRTPTPSTIPSTTPSTSPAPTSEVSPTGTPQRAPTRTPQTLPSPMVSSTPPEVASPTRAPTRTPQTLENNAPSPTVSPIVSPTVTRAPTRTARGSN